MAHDRNVKKGGVHAGAVRWALALTLLAGVLSGCLAGEPAGPGRCPTAGAVATPAVDGKYMQTDPAQPWQTLVFADLGEGSTLETSAWSATPGWKASTRPVSPNGTDDRFEVVTVEPQGRLKGNATWSFGLHGPAGCDLAWGTVLWDLAAPRDGMAAHPGQGVHVQTAGFLEDGTLFYTNIPEVDTDPRWPRVPWYEWEGDMSLPVYVYDQERSEIPAYWKSTSSNLADLEKAGAPVDPRAYGVSEEVDHDAGLGYVTTIRGFNEALKGLSTSTTRVVWVAPQDAYTLPGYEDHHLYGQAVVFYIKVWEVRDAPCPYGLPEDSCSLDVLPAAQ